jgi:hypothetical protein
LLAFLGQDLPGAVVIEAAESGIAIEGEAMPEHLDGNGDSPLKFSLGGVQLKFSGLRSDKGIVIPASGRGGNWIVKLPDSRYPRMPANEYSVLAWPAPRESWCQISISYRLRGSKGYLGISRYSRSRRPWRHGASTAKASSECIRRISPRWRFPRALDP